MTDWKTAEGRALVISKWGSVRRTRRDKKQKQENSVGVNSFYLTNGWIFSHGGLQVSTTFQVIHLLWENMGSESRVLIRMYEHKLCCGETYIKIWDMTM